MSEKQNKQKKTLIGRIANDLGAAAQKFSKAKAIRRESKGKFLRDKAELVKAKQGSAKVRSIATSIAASTASIANAMRSNNANNALSEWTQAIMGNSKPAEGTGEPSSPGSTDASNPGTTTGSSDQWGNNRGK